ncbi:MAG: M12 family metallopeptidase [Vicinamibacterales bacterium]
MATSLFRYVRCVFVLLGISPVVLGGIHPIPAEAGQAPDPHAHLVTPFDKIPDFAATPTVVSVKSGSWSDASVWSTGSLPGSRDVVLVKHQVVYDSTTAVVATIAIDAGGRWSCALTQSTKLSVDTLLAKPGSTLECGSTANPLPAQFKAEIVIRDSAIRTSPTGSGVYDPSQYGTGVVAVDATVRMHGASLDPTILRLAAEPLKGSRTLTLAAVPNGWQADDVLVIPDTRQLVDGDYATRSGDFDNFRRRASQSETVTIQAISGTTVTISKALDHDHKGARNPEGGLEILPHVGNLSRNIIIRSDKPNGTRGHVLLTRATNVDIRYVAFQNLGRTTEEPLDSTTFDAAGVVTHVGTNQIGRYPLHIHHVPGICPAGSYQFTIRGVAIENGRKWAMAVHGSHYGLIQDNVVFDATGAGIVTEDGSETGNVFDHNFVVKVETGTRLVGTEAGLFGTDPFGRKGNGFWLKGINNTFTNNVVADAREGIGFYPGATENGIHSVLNDVKIPNFPCGDTSVAGQYTVQRLLRIYNREVTGNEIYSTSLFGLGTWFMEMPTTGRVAIKNTTIWHAARMAVFHKYWNGTFDGLRVLNEGGVGVAISQFNNNATGQRMHSELLRADIQGVEIIYQKTGQLGLAPSWLFQDGFFRSRSGIALNARGQKNQSSDGSSTFEFRNIRFAALPGMPFASFQLSETGSTLNNYSKTFSVYAYQGNPNDNFRMYYNSQAANAPAPPQTVQAGLGGGCPTAGLTNQQCWDAHKVATYKAVATCTTTRAEISGGLVCPSTASATALPSALSSLQPTTSISEKPSAAVPEPKKARLNRSEPPIEPAVYAELGDQLFDVSAGTVPVGQPTNSAKDFAPTHGAVWKMKLKTWDGGVLPIEFADDIPAALRQQFMAACNSGWGHATPLVCVERTSQFGYLRVTQFDDEPGHTSGCYSAVGQARRLVQYRLNLGSSCWNPRDIHHQLGHALGFVHEEQRPDRDSYVNIELANVRPDARSNFAPIRSPIDRPGTYDFLSVMHSPGNAFAIDASEPTIVPRSGYGSYASSLGASSLPSTLDREALNMLTRESYRQGAMTFETPPRHFDAAEFLEAIERLDAYFRSPTGLGRATGLAIDGRLDFQAIAGWIFDVYLAARTAGVPAEFAFGMVIAEITQTAEWRTKHPTWTPAAARAIPSKVSVDHAEFLDALRRLDAFYAAPEGLGRPNGLSASEGPDFWGVSTWLFDTYLNARMSGASASVAWSEVVDSIRATPEWRSKRQ